MPTAEIPKYEQVKRSLIAEIELGKWAAGGVIPSEAQLLQRFNVSRPTLVRSLQDLVREGYLFRRQGKGTFVADRRGRSANGKAQRSVPVFTARHGGAQAVLGPAHIDMALRYAAVGAVDLETRAYLDKAEPGVALVVEPSFSRA